MVKRGEIWWVEFGLPAGSGPGYRRPAAVVSSNRFNRSRIATVIVAAVTSNVRLAEAPGNVRLAPRSCGLTRESVVNVSQLLTIDRSMLAEPAGILTSSHLREVDEGLRLVLGL